MAAAAAAGSGSRAAGCARRGGRRRRRGRAGAEERDEEAECPACRQALGEAVTPPCRHSLRLACFQRCLQGPALRCPLCRSRFANRARAGPCDATAAGGGGGGGGGAEQRPPDPGISSLCREPSACTVTAQCDSPGDCDHLHHHQHFWSTGSPALSSGWTPQTS